MSLVKARLASYKTQSSRHLSAAWFPERFQPRTSLRRNPDMYKNTHPFLQPLLFSSWSLIMPTMMSSLTSPPASMIFFASLPSLVCFWTCSRNMSPVARWQTQNSSRMRGACVPLPVRRTRVCCQHAGNSSKLKAKDTDQHQGDQ